jgi:hypothetical protein
MTWLYSGETSKAHFFEVLLISLFVATVVARGGCVKNGESS